MVIVLLFIFLSFYPHIAISVANLNYFETLSHVSATSNIKRAVDGSRDLFKHVMFRAFGRDFDLTLKSGTHLKAENFTARLVHGDGTFDILTLDESLIFSGHLTDKPDVWVDAHIEDTLWSIQIFDKQDVYVVEPAWRLLTPVENPKNDTLIAYRASDLKTNSFNSSQFCGVHKHKTAETQLPWRNRTTPAGAHFAENLSYSQGSGNKKRTKRLSDSDGVTCILFLVGDYTFFKGRCKANQAACLALMFAYVQMADRTFKASVFYDSATKKTTNVGLEVGEVILFSSYSQPTGSLSRHFNEMGEWSVGGKLDAFAEYVSYLTVHRRMCASHLFTDYPFAMRVLGLAWIMTLCMEASPGTMRKNCGLTSGTESTEGAIPSLQMNLVFIHELGHNFGSEHDPPTTECSAPDIQGGNFIMWSRSVSGKNINNLKFSPCSERQIAYSLLYFRCLVPRSNTVPFCGNGKVDLKEECDAGAFGVIDTNPCCANDCKLRPHATCSDLNQPCCTNCTMSPMGTLCLAKDFIECENASYCTGTEYECPQPVSLKDWTSCKDRGHCFGGICRSFCETLSIQQGLNLKGCLCQTNENGAACKWCCRDASDPDEPGSCVVHTNDTVQDGRQCYLGFCQKGVCESYSVSTILRLFRYLPPFDTSKLGDFMKTNIVASVVFLSLIVWLPPAIFFYIKDKREQSLNPHLDILYEKEASRRRTSSFRARRQRRKHRHEMRKASASPKPQQESLLFELKANQAPIQRGPTSQRINSPGLASKKKKSPAL